MVDFEKVARKVLKERTDIQYIPDLAKPIADAIVEAIEKAEQERTNFEKLKDELTAKDYCRLISFIAENKGCDCCCPLRTNGICKDFENEEVCTELLTEWANQRSDQ